MRRRPLGPCRREGGTRGLGGGVFLARPAPLPRTHRRLLLDRGGGGERGGAGGGGAAGGPVSTLHARPPRAARHRRTRPAQTLFLVRGLSQGRVRLGHTARVRGAGGRLRPGGRGAGAGPRRRRPHARGHGRAGARGARRGRGRGGTGAGGGAWHGRRGGPVGRGRGGVADHYGVSVVCKGGGSVDKGARPAPWPPRLRFNNPNPHPNPPEGPDAPRGTAARDWREPPPLLLVVVLVLLLPCGPMGAEGGAVRAAAGWGAA